MSRNDQIKNRANQISDLIISQYNTQNNKKFLNEIYEYLLNLSLIGFEKYFDLKNATGDHLTEISKTLYSINRTFDNITLTDSELLNIDYLAIIKNNIKFISLKNIEEIIYNTFDNKIIVQCQDNEIYYFIDPSILNDNFLKAVIKYRLFLKPIGARIYFIKKPLDFKYFTWKEYSDMPLNENIFASWSENGDINVRFMEDSDYISF